MHKGKEEKQQRKEKNNELKKKKKEERERMITKLAQKQNILLMNRTNTLNN